MGLFDRFKKKPEAAAPETPAGRDIQAKEEKQLFLEIAELISGGDKAVLEEVTACVTDTAGYFAAHQDRYMERGMDGGEDPGIIRWIGLVDILEARGHVCERDWKDEKEDFLYFLGKLSGMERLGLTVQEDWLFEDGDIPVWREIIDSQWKPRQCQVGMIGIDSDSYVLFACTLEDLARREKLAQVTDYSSDKV